MNDPFLTRDWSEQHQVFTGSIGHGLDRLWTTIRVSLDRINAYEFDAPWHHDQRTR